jgi:hypothetical protein
MAPAVFKEARVNLKVIISGTICGICNAGREK